jgi:large subunit ribosomal protein L14e
MSSMEVGRICVKLVGRETGRKCVIVDVVDKNFVLITGPKSVTGVRRRRTNTDHLEPTAESVEVKKGAADDEVEKALSKGKKTKFMKEELLPTMRTQEAS